MRTRLTSSIRTHLSRDCGSTEFEAQWKLTTSLGSVKKGLRGRRLVDSLSVVLGGHQSRRSSCLKIPVWILSMLPEVRLGRGGDRCWTAR